MLSGRKTILVALVLVCCGCTTLHSAEAPVVIQPPADLTQACAEPAGSVQTNKDISTYLLDLRDALRGCNAQLGALRDWIRDTEKAPK